MVESALVLDVLESKIVAFDLGVQMYKYTEVFKVFEL